ncbi:MAG TPA: hemerythrin domain-containing protein [Lutibacter sp.]
MNNIFSETDYLKRNIEKDTDGKMEFSPMDPPDAYKPPSIQSVNYDELSLFLRHLTDEHKIILSELQKFETTLLEIRKEGINKDRNKQLGDFFKFLDDIIVLHNLKEERILFPLLHDRLIDKGEKSTAAIPETAVDMLENDHIKMMQLTTLAFSLMGMASRLTDATSRAVLTDTAIEQGKSLVELIRLHIFRAENVVFALAHKYISEVEFKEMEGQMKKYFSIAL